MTNMFKKYFSFNQNGLGLRLSKGFSLVEVLVVIFVISLLSGSVSASYWSSQKRYYVSKAVQRLTVDLRRAQNMALAGATQGAVVPKGYGVYTQSDSQYIIFYNNDSNKAYNGSSVLFETIALDNATLSPTAASIYFTSPSSTAYIGGANSGSQTFTITNGGNSKTVVVDSSGKIDID